MATGTKETDTMKRTSEKIKRVFWILVCVGMIGFIAWAMAMGTYELAREIYHERADILTGLAGTGVVVIVFFLIAKIANKRKWHITKRWQAILGKIGKVLTILAYVGFYGLFAWIIVVYGKLRGAIALSVLVLLFVIIPYLITKDK